MQSCHCPSAAAPPASASDVAVNRATALCGVSPAASPAAVARSHSSAIAARSSLSSKNWSGSIGVCLLTSAPSALPSQSPISSVSAHLSSPSAICRRRSSSAGSSAFVLSSRSLLLRATFFGAFHTFFVGAEPSAVICSLELA